MLEVKVREGNRVMELNHATLKFRNFSGAKTQYNREGARNFHVDIPDEETATMLRNLGVNVKEKEPKDEYSEPLRSVKVIVSYDKVAPVAWLYSGKAHVELNEQTIGRLDRIDIEDASMDVTLSKWSRPDGSSGSTLYLRGIGVRQKIDRFAPTEPTDDVDLPFVL